MQKVEIIAGLTSWSFYAYLDFNLFSFFNKYLLNEVYKFCLKWHRLTKISFRLSFKKLINNNFQLMFGGNYHKQEQ